MERSTIGFWLMVATIVATLALLAIADMVNNSIYSLPSAVTG